MTTTSHTGFDVHKDVLAGLTVAVVALPLALAFGISSGMGAEAGITTAVIAGIVAAYFGGSRFQVSGPTGAMTVVLLPIIHKVGPEGVLAVGLMAGVMLVIAGLIGLGSYVEKLPASLVEGFTAGIAVVIALQQIPMASGAPKSDAEQVWRKAIDALTFLKSGASLQSTLVAFTVFIFIMSLHHRVKKIPLALIAVVISTALTQVLGLSVATIGELPTGIGHFSLDFLTERSVLASLLIPAVAVAALAALESLLSATVADNMRGDGSQHDPKRELIGQGLANIVTPFFGGVPATAALARTAVNVKNGAQSKYAAMLHSIFLAIIVLVFANEVAYIPLPALAGVLFATTAHMIKPRELLAMIRETKLDALILISTFVATIALDLIKAVVIGAVLSFALRNTRLSHRNIDVNDDETLGD